MDEPVVWLLRAPITTYYQGTQPWTGVFTSNQGSTPRRAYRRWNMHVSPPDPITGFRRPTPFNAFELRVDPYPYDYIERNWLGALWRRWGERVNLQPYLLDYHITHSGGAGGARRFPVIPRDMWDRAQTECLAKASRRKWNIAQTAAEMDKTVSTVVTRFRKLVQALLLIKKGKFKQAAKQFGVGAHKDRSGIWLEYQYGWRPLMSDLSEAIDAYNQGSFSDKRIRFTTKRNVSEALPRPSATNLADVSGGGTRSVFCRMDWQVSDKDWDHVKQIGLSDPLTIAWELLPFSFVVDWLVPVGTFLEALQGHVGLTYLGGSMTGKVESDYIFTIHSVNPYVSGQRPRTFVHNKAVERRLVTYPIPAIYTKWPFSSSTRIANAFALFAQLRR